MQANTLQYSATTSAPSAKTRDADYYKMRFTILGIVASLLFFGFIAGFAWMVGQDISTSYMAAYIAVGFLAAVLIGCEALRLNQKHNACFNYGQSLY